jgi:hypothetical protein
MGFRGVGGGSGGCNAGGKSSRKLSSRRSGIRMIRAHCGHFTLRPANASFAFIALPHRQENTMGMNRTPGTDDLRIFIEFVHVKS